MKKLLLSIFTIMVAFTCIAQDLKMPGYVAASRTYKFDESKTNVPMKGYYILKDGTEKEANIAYQKPEFLIGDFAAAASLLICKELTGKPMDVFNPDNEPNFKEFIKKDELKAFFINGHLYANIKNIGWRILLNEGAIHSFISVVKVKTGGGIKYVNFKQTQWFQDTPYGSALSSISKDKQVAMLEKIPPTVQKGKSPQSIVDGYRASKYSLADAVIKYNMWFNDNSEMQIDYILGQDGLTQKERNSAATAQASKDKADADKKAYDDDMKAQNDANQNAVQAPKQDHYKGRTTTVNPSVASAKPEVKVKKQKFLGRINRIKADGNKVGVVVQCTNVEVNPKSHTYFASQKTQLVRGSYRPIAGIEEVGTTTVADLNKGFGTDVFELVDMKDIPYKDDGNGGKMDDWWATKYKMVLFIKHNAYYTAFIHSTGEAPDVKKEFKGQMYVKSTPWLMAAEDGQKKLKSAGKPPVTGSYSSDLYIADESTKVYTIQDLKALVNPATDEEIVKHLLNLNSSNIAKFIKKNNK